VMKPLGWTSACALLLGLLGACTGEKKAAATDTSANATANASAASAAKISIAPPPGEPGALSKPLAQYSGDQLYALAHGLNFTGGVSAKRKCRGNPACNGSAPTMSTSLRVDAVSGEDSLSTALPGNGVIAARVLNRGQAADSMYSTQPGAQYEYYLIVYPTAANTATWSLEELASAAGQHSHHTVSTGVFKGCNHPFVHGARANFKTCAQAAAMHQTAFSAMVQNDISDPPIWVACAYGCCIAGASSDS